MENKEKQIEEIGFAICSLASRFNFDSCEDCGISDCNAKHYAQKIYGLGYRKQSEWISVEEWLPDRQCEVLAYYGFAQEDYHRTNEPIQADDLGYMMVGVLTYFAYDLNPHFQHESTGLRVTHWMPLPDAPKGE